MNKLNWLRENKPVPRAENLEKNATSQPTNHTTSQITLDNKELEPMHMEESKRFSWWQAWQLWAIVLVLISGGVGFAATSLLLKLPKAQTCSKVFWPVASASVRLYCAQTAAEDQTVDNLLKAIALVEPLSPDHPLRPEIDRNIAKWTTEILEIAEEKFQQGDLKAAEEIALRIPDKFEDNQLVDNKIKAWSSIWQEGEQTYADMEQQLYDANWSQAFTSAVRLTEIKNQYWSTTKYQEAINKINVAQEERSTVDRAYDQFRQGGIDNILTAIEKAEAIASNSYSYQDAQDLRIEAKNQLLQYVQTLIEQEKWRELFQVTSRIPRSLELEKQVQDWKILASAGSSASLDTVFGLEEAIAELERLEPNSSLSDQARTLIKRWKLEIGDVQHLEKAQELALGGAIPDLNKAIAEASLIPSANPRYSQAQEEIKKWQDKIKIIEDQPIIDKANRLAIGGNIDAWKQAIAEASIVTPQSPLYQEAQRNISTWRTNIEREEDRPFLDQAITLGGMRNYSSAIAAAEKIRPGRALYPQAQEKINVWRLEIQGENYLQEAYSLANAGTPEALSQAIQKARQVSSATSLHNQAVQNVNLWATKILDLAYGRANYSLEQAIDIAQMVPSGTTSYLEAQSIIKTWEEKLKPPALESPNRPLQEINLDKPSEKKSRNLEEEEQE